MSKEQNIWEGSPSHWINFKVYILGIFLIPLFGIGLLIILWEYLTIRTWKFTVTSQRIIVEKGVLSKTTNELELFRVKDFRLDQPFILRLVGLSNIVLITSDRTNKYVVIKGVKDGKSLIEEIRTLVDKRRDEKGVVERDFE